MMNSSYTSVHIPSKLKCILEEKLVNGVFDIYHSIGLSINEGDDEFDENESCRHLVAITLKTLQPYEDIFLLDHMVEFTSVDQLKVALECSSNLVARFDSILQKNNHRLPINLRDSIDCSQNKYIVAQIIEYIIPFIGSYFDESVGETIYYVLDEIGLQLSPLLLTPNDECEKRSYFETAIIQHGSIMYTAIWPVTHIEEGCRVECLGLPSGYFKLVVLIYSACKYSNLDCLMNALNHDITANHTSVGSTESEHQISSINQIHYDDGNNNSSSSSTFGNDKMNISIEQKEVPVISKLKSIFLKHNYTVTSINKRLGISTGSSLPVWELSSQKYKKELMNKAGQHDPLGMFITIFLFGASLPIQKTTYSKRDNNVCKDICGETSHADTSDSLTYNHTDNANNITMKVLTIENILGDEIFKLLLQLNILYIDSAVNMVTSVVQITPVDVPARATKGRDNQIVEKTVYIVTDFAQVNNFRFEPVMYVGPDSLALIHALSSANTNNEQQQHANMNNKPNRNENIDNKIFEKVLDLCAGSCVQAIVAVSANLVKQALCVELNKRAVSFGQFNIALNGLSDKIEVINGNVCENEVYMDKIENWLQTRSLNILPLSSASSSSKPSFCEADILLEKHKKKCEYGFDLVLLNPPYIPTGQSSAQAMYDNTNPNTDVEIISNITENTMPSVKYSDEVSLDTNTYVTPTIATNTIIIPSFLHGYGAGGQYGDQIIKDVLKMLCSTSTKLLNETCIMVVIGNFVDIESFGERLLRYCHKIVHHNHSNSFIPTSFMLPDRYFLYHGKPWSCNKYANLIIGKQHSTSNSNKNHSDGDISSSNSNHQQSTENIKKNSKIINESESFDKQQILQYAKDLESSGIKTISNGIIFLKFSSLPCVQNNYINNQNNCSSISADGIIIDGVVEKGLIRYLHEELWLQLAINDPTIEENENVIESYCLKHTIEKDICSWF